MVYYQLEAHFQVHITHVVLLYFTILPEAQEVSMFFIMHALHTLNYSYANAEVSLSSLIV